MPRTPPFGSFIPLLVLTVLAGAAFLSYRPLVRLLYPVPYKELVGRYAGAHGLDPFLVVAVMRVESGFKPEAISKRGARGLMQVMPDTGTEIAQHLGIDDFDPDQLFDPETSVRMGTWYLANLVAQFDRNLVQALAAYNGGRGNVRRWLEEGRWQGTQDALDEIPFAETRLFVRRVLLMYDGYRRAYRSDWQSVRAVPWQPYHLMV